MILLANIKQIKKDKTFEKRVRKLTKINYNRLSNDRSSDIVARDTYRGLLGEGAWKAFKPDSEYAPDNILYYDIMYRSNKLEIKNTTTVSDTWFIRTNRNTGKSIYDFFYTHARLGNVDFAVYTYTDEKTGNVYAKYFAKAKIFESYVKSLNDGNTYYDVNEAAKNRDCKIL